MHNNRVITDPKAISDGFNNYFVNIGPTLAFRIPNNNISHRRFLPENLNFSLFLEPTDETDIKNVINKLKEGAPGRDGISSKNIKLIKDSISYPLANMVNLSFEQGVVPDELKIAVITPLYKAKDPMFFNNYRPIPLLSVFSKIFARPTYNRILNFINRHKLFNKFQFGFRNNHSTFMALIIRIENLVNALDKGKCAVGIFLDFQKAFDTVDHSILLDKLHCYGICVIANQWFFSYLSNRQQSVVYNGYESELKVINCGVPQGSILGPLLFLLYINDLTNVSSFFMPILFADDINLFCTGTDLKEITRLVHEEISNIYDWVNANKLSLNIDKTNFMLFTPKNFSYCIDDIVINKIKIQEVNETKFLGVIIDNKLKWSAHIMYISKKIAKGIGTLLKSRKVFDNDTLLSLYHTFVYPYLHYYIHVWGKTYNTHMNDLVVLQNKAMRIISGVPPRTNMDRFYIEMSILTIKRIYNYSIGLFMYKYVNKMTPDVFDNFFRNISDIHQHNTRNATQKQFYITYGGTTRGQKTFSYCGPHTWNFIIKNINPNCAIGSLKKMSRQLFLVANDDVK